MLICRRTTAVALAAVMLLTSVSCSKLRQLQSATGKGNISQWTAEVMTQAFTAINAKIGANPADYENVIISERILRVEAIDPHKRENVDQYTYEGGIVEVTPVDVSRKAPGATETAAFKSDTVKPAVLAQVMNSAPKDSGIAENPATAYLQVLKIPPNADAPQILVTVKAPRAEKFVHYDLTGRLLNVS